MTGVKVTGLLLENFFFIHLEGKEVKKALTRSLCADIGSVRLVDQAADILIREIRYFGFVLRICGFFLFY